jgi:catechol 2,3-dioxygenase-like lactoylglutathione lyase family enzyme
MVLIFHPDATSDPDSTLPPHGAQGPGHIAFAVEDEQLDDWGERLQDHGISIEKKMTWGEAGRSLYVRDPAGNSVELATPTIWPVTKQS